MKLLLKSIRGCCIALYVTVAAAVSTEAALAQAASAGTASGHDWGAIEYPVLEVGTPPAQRRISAGIASRADLGGFLAAVTLTDRNIPEEQGGPQSRAGGEALLHTDDGVTRRSGNCPLPNPELRIASPRGRRSVQWTHCFLFPWLALPLQRAWVEVRIEGEVYWLEMPYGFTSSPETPVRTPAPSLESPTPSDALPRPVPGDHERVLPWSGISYKVGTAPGRWYLQARLLNPHDAECELTVSPVGKDESAVPRIWSLDTPKTEVSITDADGTVLNGQAMCVQICEEGQERRDTFKFRRYLKAGRTWGTLSVRVGEDTYSLRIPSSLFRSWHGHAASSQASGSAPDF